MSISIQLHFYYGFISPIYDHLLLGQSPKGAPCIHCFLLISSPLRILIATVDLSVGILREGSPAPRLQLGIREWKFPCTAFGSAWTAEAPPLQAWHLS